MIWDTRSLMWRRCNAIYMTSLGSKLNWKHRGHSLLFLKSYFTDRQQYTSTNNCKSNIRSIPYGVPQGSIIDPLLILLYINDIQYVSRKLGLRLFTDDTAIFRHQKDIEVLMQDGKDTMKEIVTWFETSELSLSLGKSSFILFHGKQKNPQRQIADVTIGKEAIPRIYSAKYIGLTLDDLGCPYRQRLQQPR